MENFKIFLFKRRHVITAIVARKTEKEEKMGISKKKNQISKERNENETEWIKKNTKKIQIFLSYFLRLLIRFSLYKAPLGL